MIKKIRIAIWLVAAFASCKEDQVIPRTNPRFSVAFVQTIDRSGAEFAANVYDLGAEEVLDYGFVYGTGTGLSINTNNFVSEKGSPGKEFRMKSEHSMPLGARIFVSAFIRTSEGVVYSQPYQFVSQGSDGFVFDRIEIPQEVYFGDTLIVFGSKLSRIPSDYRVFVQGKSAIVAKIQEGSFGIVIPRSITFQDGEGALQNVEFELKVSDKTLKVTKPVKFRQPEFVLERVQELGYTQDLVLVGDYLYDENLRVKYVNQQGENFNLTTKEVMDSRISIRLNALFTESNPKLQLSIRGQSYLIDGFLKLKETKINPDQTIEFRGFSGTATVKGENFNPFLAAYNSFRVKPDIFKIDILSVHDSELEISFEYSFDKGPGSRVSEFRMESAGITSSNPLKLEWTDPGIPFVLTNEYNQNYDEGRTVALGGKGYMINSLGIYEINLQTQVMNRIANSPTPGLNPAGIFAIPVEDKIYFAAYSNPEVRLAEKLFFVFDPLTRSVSSLPNIPSPDNSFQSIVPYRGSLYYQGDVIDPSTGADGNIRRYKFDLESNTWEKLPDIYQPDEYVNTYSRFVYKDKIYAISYYQPTSFSVSPGLYEFDTEKYTWELLGPLSGDDTYNTRFDIFVIGEKVYLKGGGQITILDMVARTIESPYYFTNYSDFAQSANNFQAGNKFYLFTGIAFWEYDPDYFF